ncbi:hypothetical protein [Arthrobacter sp. zg-Y769]|uniref:hypothetical protein n=1 Tax=Arthrobacter sp. zg-Y769 TaxID=2894191 RepID=UPI003FA4A0A5
MMRTPDLVTAELTLTGSLTTASNATFPGWIGDEAVAYKPTAREKPLVATDLPSQTSTSF